MLQMPSKIFFSLVFAPDNDEYIWSGGIPEGKGAVLPLADVSNKVLSIYLYLYVFVCVWNGGTGEIKCQ